MRHFVRRNLVASAILVFISAYSLLVYAKPAFLYNTDGSLRQFGVGLRKKTVIPAWLVAIVLAILSYFSVLYYVTVPHV
jgi:hypothetical protein